LPTRQGAVSLSKRIVRVGVRPARTFFVTKEVVDNAVPEF
jgi:hypothetical protein